jgi:hypothetical protein
VVVVMLEPPHQSLVAQVAQAVVVMVEVGWFQIKMPHQALPIQEAVVALVVLLTPVKLMAFQAQAALES